MQKTISVAVERLVKHAKYSKYVRRTTKFLAHDEHGEAREGDLVTVRASADAFCHSMVRALVGAAVAVGLGKLEPDELRRILDAADLETLFNVP